MELAITIILAFLLGASVASFLNVVADRLPANMSLIKPPSHCPVDGHVLRPQELIPIVSYLMLRGRCKQCGSKIPIRIPVVELAGGAAFALVGAFYGISWDALFAVIVLSFLLVIAVIDFEYKLVLNKVLLAALPIALVITPFWSEAFRTPAIEIGPRELGLLLDSGIAAAVGFIVFLVFALLSKGGMGGGDVKLAALIGIWVGLRRLPIALLIAVVLGGLVAILLLILRRSGRKSEIPFAPFLCAGTAVGLFWGDVIGEWYLDLLAP